MPLTRWPSNPVRQAAKSWLARRDIPRNAFGYNGFAQIGLVSGIPDFGRFSLRAALAVLPLKRKCLTWT